MQQNTALIDDIMAALDAESSQNVELIVRNTQNGATKKMALASLEQIIYSYLTTAPVVTNLASVLGAASRLLTSSDNMNDLTTPGVYSYSNAQNPVNAPSTTANGIVLVLRANSTPKCVQIVWDYNTNKQFFRNMSFGSALTIKDWQEVTANLPQF
ncbi:MAG: pyocin knob domain-containing protein [Bacteroidaceae bacterium]|nr:pyocin knob domain-containing protein [Bacteroidaceae bacterium]